MQVIFPMVEFLGHKVGMDVWAVVVWIVEAGLLPQVHVPRELSLRARRIDLFRPPPPRFRFCSPSPLFPFSLPSDVPLLHLSVSEHGRQCRRKKSVCVCVCVCGVCVWIGALQNMSNTCVCVWCGVVWCV